MNEQSARERELLRLDEELDQQQRRAEQAFAEVVVGMPLEEREGNVLSAIMGSKFGLPKVETVDGDDDDDLPVDIGEAARSRLRKARGLKAAQENERLKERVKLLEERVSHSAQEMKSLKQENVRLTRMQQTSTREIEALSAQGSKQADQLSVCEAEKKEMKLHVKRLVSDLKKCGEDLQRKDDQLERVKQELDRVRMDFKRREETHPKPVDDSVAKKERNALQRQVAELESVVKKQAQLVEVLKKQCTHLEAAKMLAFTEQEFVEAISR